MIATRIPLPALAVCALCAAPSWAQQPAAPSAKGTPASNSQASGAPTPPGNLIIQVMADTGVPVPGAAIEVDGMRTGMGPAVVSQPGSMQPGNPQSGNAPSNFQVAGYDGSAHPGDAHPGDPMAGCTISSPVPPPRVQPSSAKSGTASGAGAQSGSAGNAQAGNGQAGAAQGQPSGQQTNTVQPGAALPVDGHIGRIHPRRTEPSTANSGSSPTAGSGPSGTAPSGGAQPAAAQPPPGADSLNTVQPGTAQTIHCEGAAPAAPLPPGAVPLETDAQGQLTLQLSPGEHTLSVSVYGFDPFTGHFTLGGKHRQIVQIKLSTAPTSYILAVGPDGRIQPETPDLGTLIPLEPVQTLDSLPVRNRKRVL
jgi:hypothetical protein